MHIQAPAGFSSQAEGGFFANSDIWSAANDALVCFALGDSSTNESRRVECDPVNPHDGKTAYNITTSKGKTAGRRALSPNAFSFISYLANNARRNKNVEYVKIDPLRKLRANLLRITRKQLTRNSFGPCHPDSIPSRSVFYAIHYQPEQSTLAQGIWHVNQVALVENISKSLPLGYTGGQGASLGPRQ